MIFVLLWIQTRKEDESMNAEIEVLRNQAEEARFLYRTNQITLEEAKKRIQPYAEKFNEKSKELAKKYHVKAQRFPMLAYLR